MKTIQTKTAAHSVHIQTPFGEVKTTKRLYVYRPAKEWGLLGRVAKPWVGNPTTKTYQATITRTNGAKVLGILEHVTIKN
jgi:hypothetical protein